MEHWRFPLERLGDWWCKMFHPVPQWPIHGHYQCPKCFRVYAVPWETAACQEGLRESTRRLRYLAQPAPVGARNPLSSGGERSAVRLMRQY
jgi:hypothetical protein